MKKKRTAVPDFSSKKLKPGEKQDRVASDQRHTPDPRQPQKPPTKSKNGGRRGT